MSREYPDILGGSVRTATTTSMAEEWTVPTREVWYIMQVSATNTSDTGRMHRFILYAPNKTKYVNLLVEVQGVELEVVGRDWSGDGFGPITAGHIVYYDTLCTSGDVIQYGVVVRRVKL